MNASQVKLKGCLMAKHEISIHNKLLKFEYQYICDITIRQESFNYSKINNFLVKIS